MIDAAKASRTVAWSSFWDSLLSDVAAELAVDVRAEAEAPPKPNCALPTQQTRRRGTSAGVPRSVGVPR